MHGQMNPGGGPGLVPWWVARRAMACGAWSCGPHGGGHGHGHGHGHGGWGGPWRGDGGGGGDDGGDGGGGLGVRRPLRFLAYKLELGDEQVAELAKILDELKIERAQAEVDRRRTLSAFADAVAGATFDEARANAAGALRVDSATKLRDAVVKALGRIHALLDDEQRSRLAYLIRTGTLTL